jgi:hypothetical protein
MRWTKIKPDVSIRLFIYLYLGSVSVAGALAGNQMWKSEDFREYISVYAVLGQYQTSWTDVKKYALYLLKEKSIFRRSLYDSRTGWGWERFWQCWWRCGWGFWEADWRRSFFCSPGLQGFLFCMAGILSQLLFYIPAVILFLAHDAGRAETYGAQIWSHVGQGDTLVSFAYV